MVCSNCGQNIPDGSKFCGHCGTEVKLQAKKFCTNCGAESTEGQLFCSVCGMKLGEPSESQSQVSTGSGRLLKTLNMVSMYKGEPTVSVAASTGKLLIYDDRIEFEKQMGNALTSSFGLVGLIGSAKAVKKNPIDVYPINQISELKVGSYMGVYNTLVVKLRNGTVNSFAPAIPGSSVPKDIIELLRPFM